MWTSNSDNNLDYYILLPPATLKPIFMYLKKSLYNNMSYIVESTSIDITGYNSSIFSCLPGLNTLTLYTLYNYTFKNKLILLNSESVGVVDSIDSIYPNCNWLEREFCEMYSLQRFNKIDSRKLLLNYYDSIAPMRRLSNSKGNFEMYYNFSDRQVQLINCMDIDL